MRTSSTAVDRTDCRRHQWALLFTVSTGLFVLTIDHSVLYTALPTLTRELAASAIESLWIVNAYPLAIAGLLLATGTLGDRVGHRRMFTLGLWVFGLASVLGAFSPNPELLIAARAGLGIGGAMMMPATLALISRTFTVEKERNVAIAVWGMVSMIGAALGPVIGGLLLAHFWWGSVFLVNVPFVVLALVLVPLVAGPNDPEPHAPWDLASSVVAALTLCGLVLAIKEAAKADPQWLVAAVAALVCLVAGTLFVRRQRRLPVPLLDFTVFRNPVFSAGVLAAAMSMFALAGIDLLAVQRFQLVSGMTPLQAGLLVTVVAVACIPPALAGGATLHRIGYRPLITGGLVLAATGTGLLAVSIRMSGAWVGVALVILGLGIGAVMSVSSTAIMNSAPRHRAGMASSVEEISYEFGSLLAVSILGSLMHLLYATGVRLPAAAPAAAGESLSTALAVAGDDAATVAAARSAFDTTFTVILLLAALLLLLAACVTAPLLRRSAGRAGGVSPMDLVAPEAPDAGEVPHAGAAPGEGRVHTGTV
ncbi:MFS transporter [Brevibacterium litoralis]|uniref:MFS transporter n=1 Tax=Brevibacterium litoralis TaxID=3138935 RepID=UPI0032EF1AEC